ncbi:MAG: hypothetical protein QM765_26105 [Myxococcales bacterium]
MARISAWASAALMPSLSPQLYSLRASLMGRPGALAATQSRIRGMSRGAWPIHDLET